MPKTNFFYRGGEYCFEKHGFTAHFHPEFIHTICTLPSSVKNLSKYTMDGHWMGIRFFLDVIQKECLPLFEFLSIENASSELEFGGKSEWQNALSIVRDHIDARDNSNSHKGSYLSGIHFWVDKLAENNFIPPISHVRGFEKTLSNAKTVIDYPIPDDVKERILGISSDTNFDEIQTVYQHILLELADVNDAPEGFHALSVATKAEWVLSRRLGKIRVAIDRSIKEQLDIRKNGLRAIRKYRQLNELFDKYFNFNKGKGHINPATELLMELTYEEYRSALLSWFWYRNKGIQFKNHDGKRYTAATKILTALRKREGLPEKDYKWSDEWFASRLGLSSDMYTPCMLLLIFDNFMNVSNARQIPISGLEKNEDGIACIRWFKKRADSWLVKPVCNELQISSRDVFKHIKQATKPYRKLCYENDYRDQQNYLFLSYYSSKKHRESAARPLNPESETFTNHAKKFIANVSDNKWYMTPDMLRSSLLLLSGFNGGIEGIKKDAQHLSERTSTIYHNRPAARATFHEAMREFKEWLQTLITLNIDDAAIKLGVDPDKYEERKKLIMESRFGGLFCKDPMAGVQEGTKKGTACNKIARCLLCKNKKNLFVESVENITHLLQWLEALEDAVNKGLIDAEENINWYFWFRFIEEMVARLENNPASKLRNQALISAAKERVSKYDNPYLQIDFKEVV